MHLDWPCNNTYTFSCWTTACLIISQTLSTEKEISIYLPYSQAVWLFLCNSSPLYFRADTISCYKYCLCYESPWLSTLPSLKQFKERNSKSIKNVLLVRPRPISSQHLSLTVTKPMPGSRNRAITFFHSLWLDHFPQIWWPEVAQYSTTLLIDLYESVKRLAMLFSIPFTLQKFIHKLGQEYTIFIILCSNNFYMHFFLQSHLFHFIILLKHHFSYFPHLFWTLQYNSFHIASSIFNIFSIVLFPIHSVKRLMYCMIRFYTGLILFFLQRKCQCSLKFLFLLFFHFFSSSLLPSQKIVCSTFKTLHQAFVLHIFPNNQVKLIILLDSFLYHEHMWTDVLKLYIQKKQTFL